MATTDRINRLLVAEDWKRIYQIFRNADFQNYDFDNLKRTMVFYLRENYPEDFNDYIESSEYLALIDLIAFLGQNLAFRIDLNARESFPELAQRRNSILQFARLLSYNAKRNQAANGFLKFDSVRTSESIVDSNNQDLANRTVIWNDSSNPNWHEQFIKILNAALPVNGIFGRPNKTDVVRGVATEQYRFNSINTDLPLYKFSKSVDGIGEAFEIVPVDIDNGVIFEDPPLKANSLSFVYRDDGRGAGSSNTGFFCHFRQGTLEENNFNINATVPNQIIEVNVPNINNTDVWLYQTNESGIEIEEWTQVDAVEGNNIIYNSLSKNIRNIFAVITKDNDEIDFVFSDGVFGNLPNGAFKAYFRTSANRRMSIQPSDIQNININIPYLSRVGGTETLTLSLSLQSTVDNGVETESNDSIRTNAPSNYYTQNRMITGEDYNISPLGVSQEIIKVKTVNRTSSGISRYFDLIDATGKYSKVNLYGSDGVLYKQNIEEKIGFTFSTQTDIEGVIVNIIEPIIKNRKILNFYYREFPIISIEPTTWKHVITRTNQSSGYFIDQNEDQLRVGQAVTSNLKNIEPGSLCKFIPKNGHYFTHDNQMVRGEGDVLGTKQHIWSKVIMVTNRGLTQENDLNGPIMFNDVIPDGALISEVRPKLATVLTDAVRAKVIDQIFAYRTFGLRYDVTERRWMVITNSNLNILSDFSPNNSGSTIQQNDDASWLLLFQTNGESYTITYRGLRYVFESDREIKFYYDSSDMIYDNKTNTIIKDRIQVLSINTKPNQSIVPFTSDYNWEIVEDFKDQSGYIDTKKIQVGFFDSDSDGVVDDVDIFDDIVGVDTWIFQKSYKTDDDIEDFYYVSADAENIITVNNESEIQDDDAIYYVTSTDTFIKNRNVVTNYRAYIGRDKLKFYYVHAADSNSRLDPSSSNIMDTYMLTRQYDSRFRQWLDGAFEQMPLPPSSDQLYVDYNPELSKIKAESDEVIYNPVKYKVLFGQKANPELQAVFKIVKNPELVVNDSIIKTRTVSYINQFFALENWEFGETFYFSELSAYIMRQLAPDIVSIVIVPSQINQSFGSLFEVRLESDEIFISGATVDNIEIIDTLTATNLQASGQIITSSGELTSGIRSNGVNN